MGAETIEVSAQHSAITPVVLHPIAVARGTLVAESQITEARARA